MRQGIKFAKLLKKVQSQANEATFKVRKVRLRQAGQKAQFQSQSWTTTGKKSARLLYTQISKLQMRILCKSNKPFTYSY